MKQTNAVLILAIAFALFFLVLPAQVATAETSANLDITVRDGASYHPVVDANVSISGPQNLTATTGTDGKVIFQNITPGVYQVTSTVPSYPMSSPQTVMVTGNTSLTLLYGHTNAFFTYNPDKPAVNQTVTFDGSQSSSTGNIIRYDWNFGDGATATNASTTHSYRESGDYLVTFTVTSTIGAATYTQIIRIPPTEQPLNNALFLLLIPLVLPFLVLFLWFRRRRYYVVIQARIPPSRLHPHCPGNGDCDNCNLTPC